MFHLRKFSKNIALNKFIIPKSNNFLILNTKKSKEASSYIITCLFCKHFKKKLFMNLLLKFHVVWMFIGNWLFILLTAS